MMTHEQLQQIRAIVYACCEGDTEAEWMLVVIDAELAKPEQEPMYFGLTHDHTWLSVTPSCYKKLKPEMRMKVYTAPPNHYDQTALELCEVCGWKTLIPGDCCLNCERGKVEQEPLAAPQREWQSLTQDEINNCAGAEIYPSTWAMAFARAIEAALKEKNHE